MYNINLQEIGDVQLEQGAEEYGSTDDDEIEDEYDDDCPNQYIVQSRSRSVHDTLVLFPIF